MIIAWFLLTAAPRAAVNTEKPCANKVTQAQQYHPVSSAAAASGQQARRQLHRIIPLRHEPRPLAISHCAAAHISPSRGAGAKRIELPSTPAHSHVHCCCEPYKQRRDSITTTLCRLVVQN